MRILTILLVLWWAGLTQAFSADVVRITDRVFLVPDIKGATTRFEMIVNAGAGDEAGGRVAGIAHYLEHLVLVGRNPEHNDAAIRMFADASSNGWTNDKATVYLHNLPARADAAAADLERLFTFYAARLRNFSIPESEAARERNVVLQEHDLRIASSPTSAFYRAVSEAYYPDHPAGQRVIGTRDSIRAMTLEDARKFHQTWYVPNNVWFVVRGEIGAEKLKDIATRALDGLDARELPERLRNRMPLTTGRADVTMKAKDISRPVVVAGRVVRFDEKDRLATSAQIGLLSAFASSRFEGSAYDQLVETQQIASEDLSVSIRRVAPSAFSISLSTSLPVDRKADEVQAAMFAYIDALATRGAPDERVLTRLKKRTLESMARSDRIPLQLHGRFVSWLTGEYDPAQFKSWPSMIDAVTTDQMRALARGFASGGRNVTGMLDVAEDAQ